MNIRFILSKMVELIKSEKLKGFSSKIIGSLIAIFVGGGIIAALLTVKCQHHLEKNKEKTDIYIETKSICEQLDDEYKQLIFAKIEIEFSNVKRLRSWGGGCIPLDDPPAKKKPIDQCWLNIDEGKKKLIGKINEIDLKFDVTKELKKAMIHLKVSKFNDTLAFHKAQLSSTGDCNELRAWRAKAHKQGNAYLENWFKNPYNRLLSELKKQL